MTLTVELNLTDDSKRFLKRFPEKFKERFYRGLYLSMKLVEAKAKASFGSAGKPKVRTGHLRRSVQSDVDRRGDDLIGVVYSNLVYSRIHELGGTITPNNPLGFLRFQIGDAWIRAKKVVIPARPYLEPAMRDNMSSIEDIIEKEIVKSAGD
jgi:phage gpG-like protein